MGGLVVSGGRGRQRDEDGGRCVGSGCGQLLAGSVGESSGQTRIATLPRYRVPRNRNPGCRNGLRQNRPIRQQHFCALVFESRLISKIHIYLTHQLSTTPDYYSPGTTIGRRALFTPYST